MFLNRGEDALFTILQLTEVTEAFFQVTQLGIIESPSDFLAVPGDERNGVSFIQELDGGLDLFIFDAEFESNRSRN